MAVGSTRWSCGTQIGLRERPHRLTQAGADGDGGDATIWRTLPPRLSAVVRPLGEYLDEVAESQDIQWMQDLVEG